MNLVLGTAALGDDLFARDVALARPVTGARYLNAAARLALQVSDQLLEQLAPAETGEDDFGLCVATFGAHFEAGMAQTLELLHSDNPLVSPIAGPNNTPNAVASQLAIYLKARAFALTFCDSGTAGLDALWFATQAIASGRARRVMVVGSEAYPTAVSTRLSTSGDAAAVHNAAAVMLGPDSPTVAGVRIERILCGCASPEDPAELSRLLRSSLARIAGDPACRGVPPDAVCFGAFGEALCEAEQAALRTLPGADGMAIIPRHPEADGLRAASALFGLCAAVEWLRGNDGRSRAGRRTALVNVVQADGTFGCMLVSNGELR